MKSVISLAAAFVMLVALPSAAHAERASTTHPVTGVAIDTTGAVLPNAESS